MGVYGSVKFKSVWIFILFISFGLVVYGQKKDLNALLLNAAFDDKLTLADSLLKAGADVNTISVEGITSLMYAAQSGDTNLVILFINYNALINAKPFDGVSALIAAVRSNKPAAAELLLRNSAEINEMDYYGCSALMYASAFGLDTMADMLMYYDADVNIRSSVDSSSALNMAALTANVAIAQNLLDHGADVNSADLFGYTPLMIAIQNNDTAMVSLFLNHKADVNKFNSVGYNALHIASEKGFADIVSRLITKGADPHQPSRAGMLPREIASMNENYDVVTVLKKNGAGFDYRPRFNKLVFSFDGDFNLKDVFLGGYAGINEVNYNTLFCLGFLTRAGALPVLVRDTLNHYYQFMENRSFFYAGVVKYINIRRKNNIAEGISIGARELFTYGSYHGTYQMPASIFLFSPQLGLYVKWKHFGTELKYEYVDFKIDKSSPHRIGLNLWFAVNIFRKKNRDKVIDWV
ncbi:MAG: ankyrin repeat domain-containing protein [Bacteroidia bacterium]|nr:ankyrin repeat domain-containing protein [Bacteroidia bacterium]